MHITSRFTVLLTGLLAVALAGPSHEAGAAMQTLPTVESTCGDWICGEIQPDPNDISSTGTSSTTSTDTTSATGCETSTWGDSTSGGTQTVCVDSTGSSTYDAEEWGEDYYLSESLKVTLQSDGTFTSTYSSTDLSSSTTLAK